MAPFSRAVGCKSKFCSLYFLASSSPFRKSMTQPPAPKPWEEIDLAENPLFRVGAWSEGLGVQITLPKITCKELSGPWKFDLNLAVWSKVISHYSGHRQTDRQTDKRTDTPFESPWTSEGNILLLFYAGGWGNFEPAKFLPFHFMKDNSNIYTAKLCSLQLPWWQVANSFNRRSLDQSITR